MPEISAETAAHRLQTAGALPAGYPKTEGALHTSRRRLDGRTVAARRLRVVHDSLLAALPSSLAPFVLEQVKSAAELVVASERVRLALLQGDPGATLDDVVRLERLAASSVRRLLTEHGAKQGLGLGLPGYLRERGK
jgi:hypothetical protein